MSRYKTKALIVEKKADVINNKPYVKHNNSHDIKTHSSFGDFKTGMKHGAYAYAGITLASMIAGPLLLATAPYLILPFALFMLNPAVWAGVGVACTLASGIGESLTKPLIRSIEGKGISPLGNTLRVASTALAFTLLGPVGGIAVGAMTLTDYALKGKLTEVGHDLLSGTGNSLQNLWKGLAEKLLPHEKEKEKEKEVSLSGSRTNEKEPELHNPKSSSVEEVKVQVKELGKELTKATTNDQTSQSRINDVSQKQSMGR